ncbi:MAG: T9SS type A sorting domain-containing protein [Bacteroidota bacterium]
MFKKIQLMLCLCISYTVMYGQVQLPLQLNFHDNNAKALSKSLLKGPWDQSLRCDALDTLRFLPTCCGGSGIVPFLGIHPYQFYCKHRSTQSGGDYLSLMRNYSWSTIKQTVCDSLVILSPKVLCSIDSMPVLALLSSKNNVKMSYQNCPTCGMGTMPDDATYTAMEVSLVDSTEQSLGFTDTLEMSNGFVWKFSDPARVSLPQYRGIVRFKLRFLGEGNLGIDEIKMYHSPEVFSTLAASCGGRDGQIRIDSIHGFTAPFTYQWSTGDKKSFIDSLNPGKYTVIIEDSKGLMAKREWVLGSVLQLTVDSVQSIDTAGLPGAIILGYGGAKPMNWSWTSSLGFQSSKEKPSFYQPAMYGVTVNDSRGCKASIQIPMGIRCDQVYTPFASSDTLCFGESPEEEVSPFSSLKARYWTSSTDRLLQNALISKAAWQGLVQGWNTRYMRWLDTINGCLGSASPVSIYVRTRPTAPVTLDWIDCPNNLGFNHTWLAEQGSSRLSWRRLSQSSWTNSGSPYLNGSETNEIKGKYIWVGKYKDTATGCYSDTTLSSYRVQITYQAGLKGTKWYSYGSTSTLKATGIPAGADKQWKISAGGQFEMTGPGGSMHPCHGKSQCVSSDSALVVIHNSVPCWSPLEVVSSVELLSVSGVCTTQSKLTATDTGNYDCFGTKLQAAYTRKSWIAGETLKLGVSTVPPGYYQIDNPLHMQYANCDFYLPHQWQIQPKDSAQWLPLKDVLDTSFSTKTDTQSIQLWIPNAPLALDQCKIRLRLERCKGQWTESMPQSIEIRPDTGAYAVYPNPTLDEVVIRPSNYQEVRIYDVYGHLQFTGAANKTISTKFWDAGIYWVQVEKNNTAKTIAKFVVLH